MGGLPLISTSDPFVRATPLRVNLYMTTTQQDENIVQLDPATAGNKQPATQREVVTAMQGVMKGALTPNDTIMDATHMQEAHSHTSAEVVKSPCRDISTWNIFLTDVPQQVFDDRREGGFAKG